jgi:transposase
MARMVSAKLGPSAVVVPGLSAAERDELSRLRRENRQLRVERDILSKAAAWFARETGALPSGSSGS